MKTITPSGRANNIRQEVLKKEERSLAADIRSDEKKAEIKTEETVNREQRVDRYLDDVKRAIGDSMQWRDMRFRHHQEAGMIYVQVVDKDTGEVVRQIPQQEFLDLSSKLKNHSGITLDVSG